MDDYISRQALLDKFEPWLKVKDYNDGELNMLKAILYEIRFMPPAQPKRGKWQYNGKHGMFKIYTCDKCGWNYEAKHNYCPNCGAKMEVTE